MTHGSKAGSDIDGCGLGYGRLDDARTGTADAVAAVVMIASCAVTTMTS